MNTQRKILLLAVIVFQLTPLRASLIGLPAADFTLQGIQGQNEINFNLKEAVANARYTILLFYPADFSIVCPTELHAFQDKLSEFKKRNVQIIAISKDEVATHKRWLATPKDHAGVQGVDYPLLADVGLQVAQKYDAVENKRNPEVALRALYVIDQKGIVRGSFIYEAAIGRNTEEVLRLIDALVFHDDHGDMCPANWKKGQEGVKDKESVQKHLQEQSESSQDSLKE